LKDEKDVGRVEGLRSLYIASLIHEDVDLEI